MNFIDEASLRALVAHHGIGAPSDDVLPKANQLLFRMARTVTVMATTVALAGSAGRRPGSASSITVRARHLAALSRISHVLATPLSRVGGGVATHLVGGAPDATLPASYFGGVEGAYSDANGDMFTATGGSTDAFIRPALHASPAQYWNQTGGAPDATLPASYFGGVDGGAYTDANGQLFTSMGGAGDVARSAMASTMPAGAMMVGGGDVARAAMASTMPAGAMMVGAGAARRARLSADAVDRILREVRGRFGMDIRYSADAKEAMRVVLESNLHAALAEIARERRRKQTKASSRLSASAFSRVADKWVIRLQ